MKKKTLNLRIGILKLKNKMMRLRNFRILLSNMKKQIKPGMLKLMLIKMLLPQLQNNKLNLKLVE